MSNILKIMKRIFPVLIIMICIFIFFITDYLLAQNQKKPIFCPIKISPYNDGGTIYYIGMGYKVINFNKLISPPILVDDNEIITANYYYICSWFITYETAWNIVGNKAREYTKNNFAKYYKNNYPIPKTKEVSFSEIFENYYGETITQNLYNSISEEIIRQYNEEKKAYTNSQIIQISMVLNMLKSNDFDEIEIEAIKDWVRGIDINLLEDENLKEEIENITK